MYKSYFHANLVTKADNSTVEKVTLNDEGDIGYRFEGYASTIVKDSAGDVVLPNGIKLDRFKDNPIMLLQHDHNKPIGYYESIEVRDDGLYVKGMVTVDVDNVFKAVRTGVIRTMSIGFVIDSLDDVEYQEANDTFYIKNINLFEISLVSVPANPKALIKNFKDPEGAELDDVTFKSQFKEDFSYYTFDKSLGDTLSKIKNDINSLDINDIKMNKLYLTEKGLVTDVVENAPVVLLDEEGKIKEVVDLGSFETAEEVIAYAAELEAKNEGTVSEEEASDEPIVDTEEVTDEVTDLESETSEKEEEKVEETAIEEEKAVEEVIETKDIEECDEACEKETCDDCSEECDSCPKKDVELSENDSDEDKSTEEVETDVEKNVDYVTLEEFNAKMSEMELVLEKALNVITSQAEVSKSHQGRFEAGLARIEGIESKLGTTEVKRGYVYEGSKNVADNTTSKLYQKMVEAGVGNE